ncbi:MAG: hypothetical protein GY711_04770 [bacterium]|nr:hypothetical protein [bacterium]
MTRRPRTSPRGLLAAFLGLLAVDAAVAQQSRLSEAWPVMHSHVIDHPCGNAGARFGESTAVLDMNADGHSDVAVGAYGEGRTYIFYGNGNTARPGFSGQRLFDATGPILCPAGPRTDQFGYDVDGGNLDADPADEFVVGAPRTTVAGVADAGAVYLIGITGAMPVQLVSSTPERALLGNSVAVGDFNDDGVTDVAAGARLAPIGGADAGKVHVFFGPFTPGAARELVVENPNPVQWGNFGHHLAVGDADGDGDDDLFVSSIGNTASSVPVAGQIFCYPGPIANTSFAVIEDPNPNPADLPAPRFGMHIDARDHWLLVGANRKDWNGVHDAGLGFVYPGPGFGSVSLHEFPGANPSDYMGFRCVAANVVGDAALDFTFVVMPNQNLPVANPLALITWDGTDLHGPPARILRAIDDSGDHFGNGLTWGQMVPGGYEELVVGDPTYDAPGTGGADDTGRVVVYF